MAADCMQTLGISGDQFSVNINNRKILDAILAQVGLDAKADDCDIRRLTILRALDKLDRLGIGGVADLLGTGARMKVGITKKAGLKHLLPS